MGGPGTVLPCAAVTDADRPSPLARAWFAQWPIWAEVILFLLLMVAYEWLRDLVATDDVTVAVRHARDVIDIEKSLGLFVEPHLHDRVQSIGALRFTTTWIYTLAHTTGFTVMFLFVWFRRRRNYPMFRNWFWVTNAIAIVGYWLFPLAPPRLTGLGLADPTKAALQLGGALSWFQPFRNEFAAMPSMHVGYAFLFALTLFWLLRPSPWRVLAFVWPIGMLLTVMSTANHWWLDGVGGVTAVLIGLAVISRLNGPCPRPWEASPG
jgi:hypothetical protein